MSTTTVEQKYTTVQLCHTRKDTKQVLRYVNRIRKAFKMQPLKYLTAGYTGDAMHCSIALSLTGKYVTAEVGDGITVTRMSRLRGNKVGPVVQEEHFETPAYVQKWIERFDANQLPGLTKVR